jgi:hypothetical protein
MYRKKYISFPGWLPLIFAGSMLSGCVTEPVFHYTIQCEDNPQRQSAIPVWVAMQITEKELACFGDALRVECDYVYGIKNKDRAACRIYSEAIVAHLNQNISGNLGPANNASTEFIDRSVCIDTFIPGREALDCFDYIEAQIPLEKSGKEGGK